MCDDKDRWYVRVPAVAVPETIPRVGKLQGGEASNVPREFEAAGLEGSQRVSKVGQVVILF